MRITDRADVRDVLADAISWDDRKRIAAEFHAEGGRFESLDESAYAGLLAVARWGAEQALTYADHVDLIAPPTSPPTPRHAKPQEQP